MFRPLSNPGFQEFYIVELPVDLYGFDLVAPFDDFDNFCIAGLGTFKIYAVQVRI